MKRSLILSLLCLPLLCLGQYRVETVPNPKEQDRHAYVSNPDGILDSAAEYRINTLLDSLEQTSTVEIAVVLLNSIGEEAPRSFATALFKKWGIGKSGKDNGLLMLLVLDQRDITFETGYGLEGVLPDALCKRIQMEKMLPLFKQGDYAAGMLAGVEGVISVLQEGGLEDDSYIEAQSKSDSSRIYLILAAGLAIALISFLLISLSFRKINNSPLFGDNKERYLSLKKKSRSIIRGAWGLSILLGFFSLAFTDSWSFFLSSFLGPLFTLPGYIYTGLSGRSLRRKPIPCSSCGGMMQIQPKVEKAALLTEGQRMEESLRSVEYDAFKCSSCGHTASFAFDRKLSAYQRCSKCGLKTSQKTSSQIVEPASYSREGKGIREYSCRYCGHRMRETYSIPRLTRSSGGGFGGSSSGGGSFGGGSSGGGGSSSRW